MKCSQNSYQVQDTDKTYVIIYFGPIYVPILSLVYYNSMIHCAHLSLYARNDVRHITSSPEFP
jgi:hypothetical protein